jgi:hypothetical protein
MRLLHRHCWRSLWIESTEREELHGKEYDYAIDLGLPVLPFLHGDSGKILSERTEPTDEGKSALKADHLRQKLIGAFENRMNDRDGKSPYSTYMRDEEFQQVKLQLRAPALIREVGTDWTLTPYGDRLLTQVAAIRSSAKA